ncbi:hypothetical protein DCAR_0207873 [Daucus carota subsp. sativus]|uniref:Uncharacterized protein n=1 Tax=Daucus carota subsp. sativus TaxID=79200 RepID=A0A162AUL2_DAUCS|nr:hypothetical protein DCAR_0207873 [Daucus carota subsp. sativus]
MPRLTTMEIFCGSLIKAETSSSNPSPFVIVHFFPFLITFDDLKPLSTTYSQPPLFLPSLTRLLTFPNSTVPFPGPLLSLFPEQHNFLHPSLLRPQFAIIPPACNGANMPPETSLQLPIRFIYIASSLFNHGGTAALP